MMNPDEHITIHLGLMAVKDRANKAALANVSSNEAMEMAYDSIVLSAGYRRIGEIYVRTNSHHSDGGIVAALCELKHA